MLLKEQSEVDEADDDVVLLVPSQRLTTETALSTDPTVQPVPTMSTEYSDYLSPQPARTCGSAFWPCRQPLTGCSLCP